MSHSWTEELGVFISRVASVYFTDSDDLDEATAIATHVMRFQSQTSS